METLGIEEIMVLEAGEALEDAEHETAGLDAKNEGEAQAEVPLGDRRRALVDSFLQRCNEHSSATIRRKHLWLIVGHSKGRQFERWQAGSSQATDADERSFKRLQETPAQNFVEDLKLRKLL